MINRFVNPGCLVAIALLPLVILKLTNGSELIDYDVSTREFARKRQQQAPQNFDNGLAVRRGSYQYDRWNADTNDDENGSSENEINSSRGNPFKSQKNYACGRAVASKKNRDLSFYRDQSLPMTRPKYRPLEIRMPRIIGGDETAPGEFPWAASIKLNGQPICGGSLIDRSWILTAAHCVVGYNPKNLTVRLGAYRIKDLSEQQTIDLPVSLFIVHKEYSMPRPFSNDIAMLKLIEPIEFSDFIIPICLPNEDALRSSPTSPLSMIDSFTTKLDNNGEESGGIVITTQMSDIEIAKCFNKLEQNYLNSIGLGSIAEVTSKEPEIQHSTSTPPSVAYKFPTNSIFAYGNLFDSILTDSSELEHSSVNQASQNGHEFESHQTKPTAQSFDSSIGLSHHEVLSHNTHNPGNYIYHYRLPWSQTRGNFDESEPQKRHSSGVLMDKDDSGRAYAVKFSRLPISKELLREIQSVGSNSMPSLNLEFQQGDFMAMASDLTSSDSDHRPVSIGNRQSIRTSPHISHDGLPSIKDDSTNYSGLSGIVVGWGWVRELDNDDQVSHKGYPSVTLQKVKLPILRNNACEAWFQSQSKKITLLPSQFCAGFNSGGKDACRGDSGGPMIIEDSSNSGRYKLIGIVSAGIGCARPSLPGLYTRVASFLPWIGSQMTRY